MMDSTPHFDPEVEAILHEAAQDPSSVLLRVKRSNPAIEPCSSARDPRGLRVAEEELLSVYREEASYLLRLAYYQRVQERGDSYSRGLFRAERCETSSDTPVRDISRALRRQLEGVENDGETRREIERGIHLLDHPRSDMMSLAATSLRLAPSLSARSYVGLEHMLAGNLRSAEQVFESLRCVPAGPRTRSGILTALAKTHSLMGNPHRAQELYAQALKLNPSEQNALLSWLSTSLLIGRGEDARAAVARIDALWPGPPDFLRSWSRSLSAQESGMRLEQSPETLGALQGAEEAAGPSARLVLDALTRSWMADEGHDTARVIAPRLRLAESPADPGPGR